MWVTSATQLIPTGAPLPSVLLRPRERRIVVEHVDDVGVHSVGIALLLSGGGVTTPALYSYASGAGVSVVGAPSGASRAMLSNCH